MGDSPKHFLALSKGEHGRQALFKYNVANDERELIYQHPDAEIIGVNMDYNGTDLLSVSYFAGGYIKQHFFQDSFQLFFGLFFV